MADFDGFKSITFVHSDIERLQPVIKNMHIIGNDIVTNITKLIHVTDVAETQLLLWNGIRSEGRESERIFSLALKKIGQNSYLAVRTIDVDIFLSKRLTDVTNPKYAQDCISTIPES